MEEESKPLTAFTVDPLGFYKCERMPFGLTNTPATFQHLMENCLGKLHLSWCIIYLDDIIVFSDSLREHLHRFRGVFAKLDKAGLKLKPNKCEFFKTRITYLGHIVSSDGIETDPKKVGAVKNWTIPKTVTDVRSFLGFTNYYRRFIRGYAKVAKPLNCKVLLPISSWVVHKYIYIYIYILHDFGECCESVPLDRPGSYISISIKIYNYNTCSCCTS